MIYDKESKKFNALPPIGSRGSILGQKSYTPRSNDANLYGIVVVIDLVSLAMPMHYYMIIIIRSTILSRDAYTTCGKLILKVKIRTA